jgi:hypothetical protein
MNGLSSLEQPRVAAPTPIPFSFSLQPQFVCRSRGESLSQIERASWFFNQILPNPSVLEPLQTEYVVDDRAEVAAFIEDNQLSDFLVRSIEPIEKAFGASRIKRLKLLHDEDGTCTLFCFVTFTGPLDDAQEALASFDRNWWLTNVRKYGSKLNFDFELV